MRIHRSHVRLAAVLVTMIWSSCAYGQQGSVSGYVVDQEGKPLPGIIVQLVRVAVGQHFDAKTDRNGDYFHADLPGGEYELTIVKDGHSFTLPTRLGPVGPVIEVDGTIQTTYTINEVTVNFDLRQLAAYDIEQQKRIRLEDLQIPRKARDEFKRAFDAKDDVETAKRHLEKAIEIAPNYEEALNNLGTICYRTQRYSDAALLFERALNTHPRSIVARLNLATALLQLKQYERAAKENLAVLESHPNEDIAHAQAGIALLHIGRFDEAISHLDRAKQLDPSSALAPGYVLATLYDDLGRDDDAIAEFANFLKDNPRYSGRSDVEYRIDQLCERHAGKGDAPVSCVSRAR